MIRFGPGKDIDLSLAGQHLGARYRPELLAQNDRARGLWSRLYQQHEPGCLLADEVGKGKTYVALAVAFACLATKPKGHVLILTHSGHMAQIWKRRWKEVGKCVSSRWKDRWGDDGWSAVQYWSVDGLDHDAQEHDLPQVAFASYETLKKYASDTHDGGYLLDALCRSKRFIGIQLRPDERNALIKDMFDCDLRSVRRRALPDTQTRRILSWLDPETRCWKDDAYYNIDDELDQVQARSWLNDARFDLLIVDEAHKLEGSARHRVVARLLRKRFEKCLLVTATPFALSVNQFRKRLLDFAHARGPQKAFEKSVRDLPLDDFRKAVAERVIFPGKDRLERQLQRHMVRASWDHDRERTTARWSTEAPPEALLPTLLLERVIDEVLESGKRTHIASRRESLCSSWPAAHKSLEDSPLEVADQRWSHAFHDVVGGRSACNNDPKLRVAVDHLVELIRNETKAVVFTQRLETSKALAKLLGDHSTVQEMASARERRADRLRPHLDKVADWLELDPVYAGGVLKVMAHAADCPNMERAAVRKWWRQHRKRLGDGEAEVWPYLQRIIGRGRRLPIVVRHDADTGPDERNVEKFNLPSAPLVLIATPKAQEGIDLHHYCRHVVLFDLTWNPATMEQRIGRVHRLGGTRRANEKVTVVYCYQKGTYEQVMAGRIQQRCEMMRVLLGAGQWLDEDREVKDLDCYQMKFPARATNAGQRQT